MAIKVARRAEIPPFLVMEVMRAANEYEAASVDARHLEVGRVNAVHCAGGFRATGQSCVYSSDERGFGLATLAQF